VPKMNQLVNEAVDFKMRDIPKKSLKYWLKHGLSNVLEVTSALFLNAVCENLLSLYIFIKLGSSFVILLHELHVFRQ
jgi:hypothetical protein